MFKLEVEASFEAAHRLIDYNGPCRRVHGHHWVVRTRHEMAEIVRDGMTIDLAVLKKTLRAEVAKFDHKSLNTELTCAPTAENIARIVFQNLQKKDFGDKLIQVTVEETPGSRVIFCQELRTVRKDDAQG